MPGLHLQVSTEILLGFNSAFHMQHAFMYLHGPQTLMLVGIGQSEGICEGIT
jgi:hypothetical protein